MFSVTSNMYICIITYYTSDYIYSTIILYTINYTRDYEERM